MTQAQEGLQVLLDMAENKFLWGLLGTVIFVFSLTTWVPVVL